MRSRTFIAVAVTLALVLVGVGALYVYDHSRNDVIAKGVSVGGVDVGGLHPAAARAKLQRELLGPLNRTVAVTVNGRAYHLSAREARINADIGGMVDAALDRSRDGWMGSRAWRDLTGGSENADLPAVVDYSKPAVQRLVDRVRGSVSRPAVDAVVSFSPTGPTIHPGADGIALDAVTLRARVQKAILTPGVDTIAAKPKVINPKVTTQDLAGRYPYVIVVNRKDFRLKLFHDLHLRRPTRSPWGGSASRRRPGSTTSRTRRSIPPGTCPTATGPASSPARSSRAAIPATPSRPAGWASSTAPASTAPTRSPRSGRPPRTAACAWRSRTSIELYDEVPVGAPGLYRLRGQRAEGRGQMNPLVCGPAVCPSSGPHPDLRHRRPRSTRRCFSRSYCPPCRRTSLPMNTPFTCFRKTAYHMVDASPGPWMRNQGRGGGSFSASTPASRSWRWVAT